MLVIDVTITVASRCRQGVGLYASPGNSSWGSQRGTFLNPSLHPSVHSLPGPQENILINDGGRALLADFSLLTMASDHSTAMSSWVEGGTLRWMSPELIDPEQFGLERVCPTKESDCYALGMVVYEVLSGQTPFAPLKGPAIIFKILSNKRPGRPQGREGALFTDAIWGVVELCWKHNPGDRPNAKVILQHLEGTPPLPRPSSGVGRVMETDTADEQSDVTASDSGVFSPFRRTSQAHHGPFL